MASRRINSTIRQNLISLDSQLQRELLAELNATGKDIQKEFKNVVRKWKHKPKFVINTEIGRRLLAVTVAPEKFGKANAIWRYVDQGTGKWGPKHSAYPILPKRPNKSGLLKFQTGYSPMTAPVAKYNVGTGGHFGGWVSSKGVMHPGIEPRLFTKTINDELSPPLKQRVESAIQRAIRRAK